jgi:succinate dehydrogenase / fumarate reductase, flavoprotein subunit
MALNAHIPEGPVQERWNNYKEHAKLVNPANKRRVEVIVVGTGLAGASAAATLAELGYKVKAFCFQDSPRRAHSIAAQGGINAAKNYKNDGDSVFRLFYDTIKGGDFRARESNVHRLAEVSVNIIDQCVAQGVPFAREYGGLLDNRSFGGAQVSRTFYARGQTGQQLLLGAYQALERQVGLGNVEMCSRHELQDIVKIDNKARGIIAKNLVTGELERHFAHAVILATGGYGNVFYLSTNAMGSNVTAAWKGYKRGAFFGNPCYTQIHPTCIPVSGEYQSKLTLMSESLRNDGRVWVPLSKDDAKAIREGKKRAEDIREEDRDYYLERKYPSYGNLSPRDIASRAAKEACDDGRGIVASGYGVFLDFADAIKRLGIEVVKARYGELFPMYQNITNEDPLKTPMKIYPAVHYTMGGLWVDYELMTTVPGLYALGEANFSDHGANRLGASALMQGLADGYFVIPYTMGNYLSGEIFTKAIPTDHPAFVEAEKAVQERMNKLLAINGKNTVDHFHRALGKIMWEYCGMARSAEGLTKARKMVQALRAAFWTDVKVPGKLNSFNPELDKAMRVADFLELGELMIQDAHDRNESCGGHFRTEYQDNGEAKRNDDDYSYVSAWEYKGDNVDAALHKEQLEFKAVELQVRSYK